MANKKAAIWNGLTVEQLQAVKPIFPPMKMVVDYDALYALLLEKGWLVIRTDPSLDRKTSVGGTEAPVVKAFNGHVRVVLKQRLFIRRMAIDAWYVELGINKEEN
jgi:hypothetical protein